jgi:hypothetical protein
MKKYSINDADKIKLDKSEAKFIVIPIILFLAIAFVVFTCLLYSHWSASNRWEKTTAKVGKSYITNECVTTNPDNADTPGARDEDGWEQTCQRVEVPHIKYAYDVDGKRYISERISLQGPAYGAPGQWKGWADERKVGKQINIWYDPEDPDEAVIDKSWSAWGDVVKVLVSGLLLAGAVGAWRFARRGLPS